MSISSSSVRARTAGGIWSAVRPATQSTRRSLTDFVPSDAAFVALLRFALRAVSFERRLLVAADRHEVGDGSAGRAELDRNHARIADDLAAVGPDFRFRRFQVFDCHREVL